MEQRGSWDVRVGQMDNDLWYVVVVVDGEDVLHRPGFRTRDAAGQFGYQWVKDNLDDPQIEGDFSGEGDDS
jgi:hypothetical protein